jgi:hypothetical protein
VSALAQEYKARRPGMSVSDGNGTSGTKARSEETGANLGQLEAGAASPSRDSGSLYAPLQDKVSLDVFPLGCWLLRTPPLGSGCQRTALSTKCCSYLGWRFVGAHLT